MKEVGGRFFLRMNDCPISFSDCCLVIDGEEVIRRVGIHYVVHSHNKAQFCGRPDVENENALAARDRLAKVAGLLNEGKQLQAIFLASSINWLSHNRVSDTRKANFNPAEPRQSGKWSRESLVSATPDLVEDVQYRGYFHDVVVDDLLKSLRTNGSIILKNVSVLGLNTVIAIPDGASLSNGSVLPYFIEVKTGNDPEFTPNQNKVYPLICIGGHATSFDPRINQLGLIPGVPFPPMKILLVHTYGPGLPITLIDYCVSNGLGPSNAH